MTPALSRIDEERKSILPIVLIVVSIVMAGGFFGMKIRNDTISRQPIALATGEKSVIEMDEKLVNLADKHTYMRVTLALHLRQGYDSDLISGNMAAIDDSVIRVLGDKLPDEVTGSKNLHMVKKELAFAINKVLAPKQSLQISNGVHPDWDSENGPVLKIYFRALAIQ
jgi:flagellar basal body-associated protein FliL